MKRRAAAVVCLLLCALLYGAGSASTGDASSKNGVESREVELSGRVRMVGNSPLTSVVISGTDREWYIAVEEEEKLAPLQQQMVVVRAEEYYYDRYFANGTFDGRQYYLKNIVIISPK